MPVTPTSAPPAPYDWSDWVSVAGSALRHIRRSSLQTLRPIVSYSLYVGEPVGRPPYEVFVEVNCDNSQRRSDFIELKPGSERAAFEPIQGQAYLQESTYACDWARTKWTTGASITPPKPSTAQTDPRIASPGVSSRRIASTGTGFILGRSRVVTNYHVVDKCAALSIRFGTETLSAELVAQSEAHDLAVLGIAKPIGVAPTIRTSAAQGEDVTVAGYPLAGLLSDDLIVTSGQVNSLAGLRNDPSVVQISAPVQPGNSGGPLLDRSGAIVGVVVSKLNARRLANTTGDIAQNVNFAIKPEVLRLFLDANRVPYRTTSVGQRLDGVLIAERARQFTVQILCLQ